MSLDRCRILLVEDNAELAANVSEILEDEGSEVVHADTAGVARSVAGAGFDVALVDVNLPDSTGLDLLRELRGFGNGTHEVLLVTGNATIQDAIEAVKGGAYDYIIKPFRVNELLASVERAWRQVQSSREARMLSHAIVQREKDLRTLVDTVQALLLVLDSEAHVVQANPAVAGVTGLDPAALVGVPWFQTFVPGADREEAQQVFARILAGESRVPHENRIVSADGQVEHLISWQSSPVEQPDGSTLVYSSGLDVSELRLLEQRTRLAERLAAVGTLSAGLAHEIRNPLNSAKLQLQLLDRRLKKSVDHDKLAPPVRLVQHELERLSKLVQEFLDFARPDVLHPTDSMLCELIAQVVELERPGAEERGITIELTRPETPVAIAVDHGKFQQIILNLVRNAVEAIESEGQVRVVVEHDGTGGLVRIHDTGPGIPSDVIDRIFEPFFSTKEKGIGLGMPIVHSLVTLHGGSIRVESNPGGTVFEITLPRRPPT